MTCEMRAEVADILPLESRCGIEPSPVQGGLWHSFVICLSSSPNLQQVVAAASRSLDGYKTCGGQKSLTRLSQISEKPGWRSASTCELLGLGDPG